MSSTHNILVCVTQQKTCERFIKKAASIRDEFKGNLYVIHVVKNHWNFLDSAKEGEALEYLFGISKSVGANLTVLRSDNIVNAIVEFSNDNKINHIIMGESPNDHKENNFYNELKSMLNNVEIIVVPQSEDK